MKLRQTFRLFSVQESSANMMKQTGHNLKNFRSVRSIAWISVVIVCTVCILNITGWLTNITLFKSVLAHWSPMKPISAVCFFFSILSLAATRSFPEKRLSHFVSVALGIFICLTALLTILLYGAKMLTAHEASMSSAGILKIFFGVTKRMAFLTAILFLFVGTLLILLTVKSRRCENMAHMLAMGVFFTGYIIPISYILGIYNIHEFLKMPMALYTGIAFCLLCLAVFCFYPDTWLMRVFTGEYAGSIMARRLLAGFLIIPIIIAWLGINAERTGIFTSEVGLALAAVTFTYCLLWIVWLSAKSVNETDKRRRESEEVLRQNEQRLNYHVENSPLAIVEWNAEFIVIQWSKEAERIFGWKAEEVVGKRIDSLNMIYDEDISIVNHTMERLVSGKESKVISTNRNCTRSGAVIVCTWYNSVLLDEEGRMTSVLSLVQDITERRKAERLLLQSREQYRMLVEMSPYAVFLNRNNQIVYVNPAALDLWGASDSQQILGKTPFELFHPDSHSIVGERIKQLQSGSPVPLNEEKIIRLDGSVREVEVAASPFIDQEGQAIQVILHDITENKRAQALVYRYQLISKYARDPLLLLNLQGRIIEVNQAAESFYGYSRHELLQMKIQDFRQDSKEIIGQQMQQARQHGILFETFHKQKDGTLIPVEVSSLGVVIEGQEMLLSVIRDIRERKKKESELLKLNQTLKAIDKCSQAMVRVNDESSFLTDVCNIIVIDCHYTMVWIGYAVGDQEKSVKPMAYAGFERGYLESLRITWADTERGRGPTGTAIRSGKISSCRNMHTDPLFKPWREEALKQGYASSIALPLTANGKTFGAITIYSKEPDSFSPEEMDLLAELASDLAYGITAIRWKMAQVQAEEQLKKYSADLKELNATKDKFFGIIAHDLRNPFASLLGTSEILSGNLEQFNLETIKKFSVIMHNAAKSGYAILENLLEWSRSQTGSITYNPQKIMLHDIITQNLNHVAVMAANKNIKLQTGGSAAIEIFADSNMMHSILRNLLTNAIKFTPRGGEVSVDVNHDKNEVIVTVKDTGIGMREKDVATLFRMDVKYTNIGTAEERGTGLGLLLCKEFIEKHGGRIWVESTVGKGSSFNFSLPL